MDVRGRRRSLAALTVPALMAVAVYTNTLSFGAAWDDQRFVFESGARSGVTGIPQLLTSPFLQDLPAGRSPYRPVTASSYALDWTLSGGRAQLFHWTNVVLHAAVTVFVVMILLRLGTPAAGAALAGTVFAVHPVHVEAVANLAGRSELLAALFVLAAVAVWLGPRAPARSAGAEDATPPAAGPGLGRSTAVLVLFALALGAKEHAIVLPALLALVAWARGVRDGNPVRAVVARWPQWAGLLLVATAYMGARRAVLGTFTTHDVAPFIVALPAGTRVTTAVANWAEYARLMVYPRDLVVDYGPAVVLPSTATDPAFWSGLVVGLGAVALALVAWRRAPVASLGILWFAAAVAPVSNIAVPIAQWVAERFLYLPSVGFVMVLASAATRWPRLDIRARRAVGTAAVLALLALSWRTWTRNATWETSDTVANTLIDEHPEAFRAQWLLGRALLAAGRTDPGFQALDNAIALNPNSMEPYTEKASWLLRLDRPGDAEALMRGLPEGRHADREATLVRALVRQGRRGEADLVLQEALARFPRSRVLSSLADSLAGIPPIP